MSLFRVAHGLVRSVLDRQGHDWKWIVGTSRTKLPCGEGSANHKGNCDMLALVDSYVQDQWLINATVYDLRSVRIVLVVS